MAWCWDVRTASVHFHAGSRRDRAARDGMAGTQQGTQGWIERVTPMEKSRSCTL